jgi:hypothetical protein
MSNKGKIRFKTLLLGFQWTPVREYNLDSGMGRVTIVCSCSSVGYTGISATNPGFDSRTEVSLSRSLFPPSVCVCQIEKKKQAEHHGYYYTL